MKLSKCFYCFLFLVNFSVSACANQAHDVEILISSFLGEMTECEVDVSLDQSILVSGTGNDYSSMVPKILPSDLQVIASTKMCETNDKYYFWLRKSEKGYQIVSYTSFSQPE
ncbi:hypothetical protein [Microbulbifer sp. VAAF005]|uniref:hypothetical protein n=1 Tax=Microbulbifer sp. VAAF005 TaxID=3034230 RepID=UPI0024AD569E|nr:hypothetical protein [Microbulbifer sp. VAAF005]WHI47346.1 hypothetical protein P0078_02905 [Microbulbifer sp. VAAF005]